MEEVIDRLWKWNDSEKCSRIIEKRGQVEREIGFEDTRKNFNAGSPSWNIRFDRFTALAAIVRFIACGNGIVRGRFTRPPIDCLTPIFFFSPSPPLFFSSRHSFFSRELTARGVSRRWMARCEAMSGIVIRPEGWELRMTLFFGGIFFFQRCKDNGIFFHEEKSLFLGAFGKIRWVNIFKKYSSYKIEKEEKNLRIK